MSNTYFRQVPDLEYVNRNKGSNDISNYINVKNLFKRGKLREDIIQNLTFFTKYKIEGDERPDQVAQKVYDDSTLDWVVLLSNNIINVRDEWPMSQYDFQRYIDNKYDPVQLGQIHHYETKEIRLPDGVLYHLLPELLIRFRDG